MTSWSPQHLATNLTAGLIAGLLSLTYSIAYAALIFSGDLSPYLSLGIQSALVGAVVLGLITALNSSLPFVVAGPDGNAAAILALMATTLVRHSHQGQANAKIATTVCLAILLSTILTGVFLWVLGRLHLGQFIRFIPYPVVGGFLAGVGWLLVQGSFKVMTDKALTLTTLVEFWQPDLMRLWIPGLLLAIILKWTLARYRSSWILPSLLIGTAGLLHSGLYLAGISRSEAIARGWLFEPFAEIDLSQPWSTLEWQSVQWSILWEQTGSILTLFAVVAITILLCATSLEIATDEDMDLDHELRVAGIANVVAGSLGGMVGHLSVSRSLLNREVGATHRLSGVTAALVCCSVGIWGNAGIALLPRAVMGGLLLYLGIVLLAEWVYDAYFKLSAMDYALVVAILLIGARFGFLTGVGVGLLIACLLFVISYGALPVIRNTLSGLTYRSRLNRNFHEQRVLQGQGKRIQIFVIQGYLFFGTAYSLLSDIRSQLSRLSPVEQYFFILDFRLVSGLDSSALNSFIKMRNLINQMESTLIFTGLSPKVESVLRSSQKLLQIEDHGYRVFPNLDNGVEWCESTIIEQVSFQRRKRFVPFVMQLEEFFANPQQVQPFIQYLEKIRVAAGDIVFMQGEPAKALYFIESGQVSLHLEMDNGVTKQLQTSGSGTIVGEVGLYGQTNYAASCISDKSSCLYQLSRPSLEKMQQEEPALAAEFNHSIARILAGRLVHTAAGVEKLLLLQ